MWGLCFLDASFCSCKLDQTWPNLFIDDSPKCATVTSSLVTQGGEIPEPEYELSAPLPVGPVRVKKQEEIKEEEVEVEVEVKSDSEVEIEVEVKTEEEEEPPPPPPPAPVPWQSNRADWEFAQTVWSLIVLNIRHYLTMSLRSLSGATWCLVTLTWNPPS